MGLPFSGTGEGGSWENGVWDWKVLPMAGTEVGRDEEIGASWSWSGGRGEGTVVSFDDDAVVREKTRFVRERGLGGVMWWESSGDRKVGEGSMIEMVRFAYFGFGEGF